MLPHREIAGCWVAGPRAARERTRDEKESRLHVLDYAGAAFDDESDATWGLVADWAGATVACERTGGGFMSYHPSRNRLIKGSVASKRVVRRRDEDVGSALIWRRSPPLAAAARLFLRSKRRTISRLSAAARVFIGCGAATGVRGR